MNSHEGVDQPHDQSVAADPLVLPLDQLDRTLLPVAGGKAGRAVHAERDLRARGCSQQCRWRAIVE